MSPFWGHLVGVFTVLIMASFLGIWIWAWHRRHRPVFTRMARLPMEDDAPVAGIDEDDDGHE